MACAKLGPSEKPIGKSNQPVKKQPAAILHSRPDLVVAAMSSSWVKCSKFMKLCKFQKTWPAVMKTTPPAPTVCVGGVTSVSRRGWDAGRRGQQWLRMVGRVLQHTRKREDYALRSRLVDCGSRDAEQDHYHVRNEDGYHPHGRAFTG